MSMRSPTRSAALALLLATLPSLTLLLARPLPAAADDLDRHVKALIEAPQYRQARWGILAVEADSGKVVCARNADMLFSPASVTKLFTCAGALVGLGPDRVYETPVYRRGDVKDGHLDGDLILVAQGDLTLGGRTLPDGKMAFTNHDHIYAGVFTSNAELTDTDPLAGLDDLARQVKAAGVQALDGDVLIDDRLFAHARGSGSGPGLVTPVLVNDNLLDLVVSPGAKPGEPATVKMRPVTDFLKLDLHVETVEAGKSPSIRALPGGPSTVRVEGHIAAGSPPLVRVFAVEDPAAFARGLFIEALRRAGVAVQADLRKAGLATLPEREAVAKLPRVAVHAAPPLRELLKVTLKVSHNPYASTLPLLLAVHNGKRTLPDGLVLERKVLADLGVEVENMSLESGAGGGNADRVTPRVTVQLLQGLRKRPDFPLFRSFLPILGVDGTLFDVVGPDSPARGKVWAKTGTYGDPDLLNDRVLLRSKSLAGYLMTAGGKELVFAAFVNDVALPKGVEPAREGKALGRLCEIIHRHAP
jgi:D-alanyl-D-alanine carboxypeptidase/D-alanyl-D-alanine-endopeptidase (penicillin-binding protein 4)